LNRGDTPKDVAGERQFVRVGCSIPAEIAVHTRPPLSFRRCTVVDLSAGGAKCVYAEVRGQAQLGAFVQLKLVLPGTRGQLFVLAHLMRVVAPGVVGLNFIQMTDRDRSRLTACCQQLLLKRSTAMLSSPEQRGHTP